MTCAVLVAYVGWTIARQPSEKATVAVETRPGKTAPPDEKYQPILDLIEDKAGGSVDEKRVAGGVLFVKATVPSKVQVNYVWDEIKKIDKEHKDIAADIRIGERTRADGNFTSYIVNALLLALFIAGILFAARKGRNTMPGKLVNDHKLFVVVALLVLFLAYILFIGFFGETTGEIGTVLKVLLWTIFILAVIGGLVAGVSLFKGGVKTASPLQVSGAPANQGKRPPEWWHFWIWPRTLIFSFFDNEKEAAKFWRYMVIITVALVVTSLVLMWIFRNQWYLVSWEAFWIAIVCLWLAGAFVHFKTKAATVAAFIILAAGVYGIWDRQKNHKPFAEYMELEEEKPSPVNAKAKKRKKFQIKLPAIFSGNGMPPALKGPIPEDIEAAIDKHFGPLGEVVAATAKKICECESSGCNQFEEDGDVFRGKIDPNDIGAMAINLGTWYDIGERYYDSPRDKWPKLAEELGLDIFTVDGNIAFARVLYDNEYGFYRWYKSASCWNPGDGIQVAGRTLPAAKVIPVPAYGETETYTPPMYSCVTFAEERRRPFKVSLWRPHSTRWSPPIDLHGTSAMQDIGAFEKAKFMSKNGRPATIVVLTAKPPGGDYRNCIRAFR